MESKPVVIANFMDTCLEDLEKKGNLSHALNLFNPKMFAKKVIHFSHCPNDNSYKKIFSEKNIEIFSYFLPRNLLLIFKLIPSFFTILLKIKKENVSIIRGRLPYFGSLIGVVIGKILIIPSVVSLGGDNRIPQKLMNRYYFGNKIISYSVEKFVLLHCDVIISPNHFTARYISSIIGIERAEKKTEIIPWINYKMSVSTKSSETILNNLGINPEIPIILIVGYINKYKFSDLQFEIAENVLISDPNRAQFIFCGDGELKNFGQEKLKTYFNIKFIGWQPNDIVMTLIEKSSIILVPMSGYVLLEAAAFAKPVISSNVEWHSELIKDGVNGFLVNPTSINEWSERIQQLLENKNLAEKFGNKLKDVFESEYNPDLLINKEIGLYKKILGSWEKRKKVIM